MLAVIFLTQISWGTITKLRCPICSQKALGFRNACFYCTNHSFAKSHSSLADYLLLLLELPLEVHFAINAGAAFAVNVTAKAQAHIQTFGSFEGYACSDGHTVATVISGFVIHGFGQAFQSKISGAIVV